MLLSDTRHPCAVPECTKRIGHGYLMCFEHWQLVPVLKQREVNRAWAVAKRTHGRSGYATSVQMTYADARKRAIESARAAMGLASGLPAHSRPPTRPVNPATTHREDTAR